MLILKHITNSLYSDGQVSNLLCQLSLVQFSPLTDWVRRADMKNDSAEILFQRCLQEAIVSNPGIDRDVHSLMSSIQHFLLLTTASHTLQGVRKDGFGEAVVACDMPESYKFPSLDSC